MTLKGHVETSLLVQCLRPHALNAGSPGSIPGQETRSHMPQLTQLRIGAAEFFFKGHAVILKFYFQFWDIVSQLLAQSPLWP